jgi:phospholipase/lecithinase/hemolysin
MGMGLVRRSAVLGCALVATVALFLTSPSGAAGATTFDRIVVFGDSLSDSGNAFVLWDTLSAPPYESLDPLGIPDAPYAKGGHHFTNGATWVEQFARPLALAGDARPALPSAGPSGGNYAVGGARAYDDGMNANLPAQVATYLADAGGAASTDTLYVIEFGGNDLRDALAVLAGGGDPGAVLQGSIASIGNNVGALYAAGARRFLVWNAPDLRLAPAIRGLDGMYPGIGMAAGMLSQAFNAGLAGVLGSPGLSDLPGIEITLFDVFQKVHEIAANPQAYGLDVVDAACVTPGIPPFACQEPEAYLFWDGIHPTTAVHGLLAQAVSARLAQ